METKPLQCFVCFSSKAQFSFIKSWKTDCCSQYKNQLITISWKGAASSNLHEHIGEVEISCQDAAVKERGAQSRWSAPGLCPSSFVGGSWTGQIRLLGFTQGAQESSEQGQHPQSVTLTSKAWAWYSQIYHYCIEISIRSYTIFKTYILKELLYKGHYLKLSALYLNSTCRFILSVSYYFYI